MNIEIGYMTLEDLDDVMTVETESFTIPWSKAAFEDEIIKNELAVYFVAKSDGKVIGYGGMWKILDEGHITNIAVHPDFRRLKVGSRLLQALRQFAENHEINMMTLEVRESNRAAQSLYSKFDFKVSGKRKKYYEDNDEDALIMSCEDWGDSVEK